MVLATFPHRLFALPLGSSGDKGLQGVHRDDMREYVSFKDADAFKDVDEDFIPQTSQYISGRCTTRKSKGFITLTKGTWFDRKKHRHPHMGELYDGELDKLKELWGEVSQARLISHDIPDIDILANPGNSHL